MSVANVAVLVANRLFSNFGERLFAELDAQTEHAEVLKGALSRTFGEDLTARQRLVLTLLVAEGLPFLEGVARRTPSRLDDILAQATRRLLGALASEDPAPPADANEILDAFEADVTRLLPRLTDHEAFDRMKRNLTVIQSLPPGGLSNFVRHGFALTSARLFDLPFLLNSAAGRSLLVGLVDWLAVGDVDLETFAAGRAGLRQAFLELRGLPAEEE